MPGITPSRYVRGIPNPHSAYASVEIPENVTIFKNLFRWQTTVSTTISVSQFYHCHDLRANNTRCNSRAPCHPTKGLTVHTPSPAFTPARFLPAQIHADPYTHEYCECAVTWFITPQDYHSLPGAETRLFSLTSQSFLLEPPLLLWVVCDFLLRFTERVYSSEFYAKTREWTYRLRPFYNSWFTDNPLMISVKFSSRMDLTELAKLWLLMVL